MIADNNILFLLGGIFVVYYVYRQLRQLYLKKKLNAELPPLLPGSHLFYSRNPYTFLKAKQDGTLLSILRKLFENYGMTWRARLGHTIFVTSDPENIKAILASQFTEFVMGLRHSHFKPLLGDGVFTLDGHGWKQSRALLRPNFSREKVAHTKALEKHVQNLAKHITKHDGDTFDLQDYFFRYTVDTATEFLFGESLFGLMDETIGETSPVEFDGAKDFYGSFTNSQEYCATRAWCQNVYFLINPKSFRDSNKVVHDFAKYYINKALDYSPDHLEKLSSDGYVFLYELVKETRDRKVLRDQLLNIMIAGRDTTAGLLSFCFYELARNPEVFEKLKQEIYEVFGTNETVDLSNITFETLKKCEYLKFVINETLRMYPNVPINFRCATKDTTLPRGGGKDGLQPSLIEKGTVVAYLITATHRNTEIYGKDANVFRPERWANKDLKPGWAFLPFNGGPRICLGQQFALTEASYTIVRLIQMFPNLVSGSTGEYPPRISSQLTISLVEGTQVKLYK